MSVLIGNLIRCQVIFKDINGDKQDPTTVQVAVKEPDTTITVYVYGTDPEVVRTAVGTYYIETDTTDAPGTFQFIWQSSGTYQAVGQTEFTVVDTLFDVP